MDMDFACRWPVRGFKILLHNPAEFPQMGTQFIRVPLKRDVVAVVRPSIMDTSSGLENYAPKARQCFFSHEKRLLYFNVYTQGNCEMECLINITREVCSCTAFYVPNGVVDHDTMMTLCECLPSCTEVKYDVETSQSQLVWPEVERFIFSSRGDLSER
uniref:Uncharacterized protein n=1 Tax=Timema bartmani TaxID=61472 RepID=A0A7R9FBH4_9NEOP|nr:unnamed protein product [Timema bartmani]